MKSLSRLVRLLALSGLAMGMAACAQPSTPTPVPMEPSKIPPSETAAPLPTALPTDLPLPTEAESQGAQGEEAHSTLERDTAPVVALENLAILTTGGRAFTFDLYHQLKGKQDNLFYSPYSLSVALAMAYAGARTDTADQFAKVLHYTLPQATLHPAYNALALQLDSRSQEKTDENEKEGQRFQLNVANSTWGQQGYPFLKEYLDLLAVNYGSGLNLVDFIQAAEPARLKINDWVSQETNQKIRDLIPAGAITPDTRLVLANAVYFKASWLYPFDEKLTEEGPFTLLDNTSVTVPMMSMAAKDLSYAQGEGYQIVELPYTGNQVVMDILVPDAGKFDDFEASLDASRFDAIVGTMGYRLVLVTMPKFQVESEFDVVEALSALGMPNAFDSTLADFSGMDGKRNLFISDVVHKAVVSVDEAGTEAAAATAVMMGLTSVPTEGPVELVIDRPFLFVIRDVPTGEILFVGRVLNPGK